MGKNKGTASAGKKRGQSEVWTAADHQERTAAKQQKGKGSSKNKMERAKLLDHGTSDRKDAQKLNLHIIKTKRAVDAMRDRLKKWDAVNEEKRQKEADAKRRKQEEEDAAKEAGIVKKRQRLGPESWKLRGAARPAWEVYDFDTRYVDPHLKAHEEAKASIQRSQNMLLLFKNKFGGPETPPVCREYLGLLMQLGLLYRQSNKIKAARSTLLEVMDLDSVEKPITLARCHLMRLYLEADRPDSVQRLLERLPENDKSVWIQYSRVLIEYRNRKEDDTSALEAAFVLAVRANVYCAFYLAFGDSFDSAIEYAEEIEDATDEEPLEEAIEYCNSEQRQAWEDADGLQKWVRTSVLAVIKGKKEKCGLTPADLDWETPLQRMEAAARAARAEEDDSMDDKVDDTEEEVDVLMFAGMFRTAMEMVEDMHELRM
jgi:hypothetical protein